MRSIAAALLAALLVPGCSSPHEQPGGVTADEAQQLNDAAAMLDERSVDADALRNTSTAR